MESPSHVPESISSDHSHRLDHKESKAVTRHDVALDIKNLKVGDHLEGSTGVYEFVSLSDLFESNGSLLECRVKDPNGREFFVHNKNAETQALAAAIGRSLLSPEETGSITYPEIRLETINGSDVVLMEWFDGFRESGERDQALTPKQKAHLVVTNLWMANVDFRPEHVLVDDRTGKIGLIDLERAFRFNDPRRLDESAFKMPFLEDGVMEEEYSREIDGLGRLGPDERDAMIAKAVGAGVAQERAEKVVNELFERRGVVASELGTMLGLRRTRI